MKLASLVLSLGLVSGLSACSGDDGDTTAGSTDSTTNTTNATSDGTESETSSSTSTAGTDSATGGSTSNTTNATSDTDSSTSGSTSGSGSASSSGGSTGGSGSSGGSTGGSGGSTGGGVHPTQQQCYQFCNMYQQTCGQSKDNDYPAVNDCIAVCPGWSLTEYDCRVEHLGYVQNLDDGHCGHAGASGNGTC